MFLNKPTGTRTKIFNLLSYWLCIGCYCSAVHSRNVTSTVSAKKVPVLNLSPNVSSKQGRIQSGEPRGELVKPG